ncbi:hypothetical protein ABIF66_010047 [Bradyrhizobium japonicum]|jgi:hypothetical protein|nr:hypothetical protein [Bradyrhizobium japonicum]MCP1782259.1 hypothetical protein [Bradyrhizobium japonicum]MCP1861677.1 hypothetical protein [Bradyrhizobium japonicum]MCP1892436.1 hypothetical protein [Bradyrhizobium japonicum]MCP1965452.1 hypothetical protein [Bradyrhizobium japonicum]
MEKKIGESPDRPHVAFSLQTKCKNGQIAILGTACAFTRHFA